MKNGKKINQDLLDIYLDEMLLRSQLTKNRAEKGCQTEDGEMEVLSEMNVSDLGERAFESQASVGVEREGSEQCSREAGVHRLRIE